MRIFLISVNLLLATAVFGQDPVPVKDGKLYGFSRDGKQVIAPQFTYATHFRDGVALVQQDGKWGYINPGGAWLIPAVYDAAQPMVEGKALVFSNGKTGLVSKTGKVLLQPVYDRIEEGWNEGYIYKDSLMGLCDSSWNILIEPGYIRLSSWTEGYNALRPDGRWDVYARNRKIAEGLTQPANSDYIYNTRNIILEQNGKVGIYDLDKGWLVKPEYDTIYKQDFYEYRLGESTFRFLYILNRDKRLAIEGEEAGKLNGELFRVAYADGRLVSDRYYTWIYAEPWGDYQADTVLGFRLHHSQGTTFLSPSLQKLELPYRSLDRHMDWYIGTRTDGKQDILRSDLTVIATYAAVRVNSSPSVDPETGEIWGDEQFDNYLPALLVSREPDHAVEAVYSLADERVVSPFLDKIKLTVLMEGSTDTYGFIYAGADGKGEGFFFPGMENGTGTGYSDVRFLEGKRVVATLNGKRVLYRIQQGKLDLLASEKEIVNNSELISYEFFPESDVAEPSQTPFTNSFWVIRNEAGKLGVLANNDKLIPCQFDSIIQNASLPQFVDGWKNGKCAAINVETGEQINGFYQKPLTVIYNDSYNYYYAFVEQADSSFFVDKRGRFFSTTGEYYPFKRDGKMGAKTYSEVSENGEEVVIIPPVFKTLKRSHADEGFIEVKSAEGLLGVLNPRGDTVIPILYKELEIMYLNFNEATVYRTKTKEGGVGLASAYKGVIIPAMFDSWEEYYTPEQTPFAIMVRKGDKRGLYSYDGEELLPCVYNEIAVLHRRLNDDDRDMLIIAGKDGKWVVFDGWFGYADADYQGAFGKWTTSKLSVDKTIHGPFDCVLMGFGYLRKSDGTVMETALYTGKTKPAELTLNGVIEQSEGTTLMWVSDENMIGIKEIEGDYIHTVLKPQFSYVQLIDGGQVYAVDKGEAFLVELYGKNKNKRYKLSEW